jgi:hypothetical protein
LPFTKPAVAYRKLRKFRTSESVNQWAECDDFSHEIDDNGIFHGDASMPIMTNT